MSKNFHGMQSLVYTAEDSSCPQNQISQESQKSRRVDDVQGYSEHKRPTPNSLRNQGNCTPEQVAVHNMHVPFFPDIQFYNQVPDGSVANAESSSSLSSLDSGMYSDNSSALAEHGPSSFAVDAASDVGDKNTGDDKSYAMVPARTALLSDTVKYSVTIGELKRRINHPECLHASLIKGILRKAKAKCGNEDLRKNLQTMGIELPHGRRKILPNTAFTALTEGEAMQIAKDYKDLLRREFKSKEIAAHMLENRRKQQNVDLNAERERLNNVRKFFVGLQGVISRVGEHPREYNEKEHHDEIDEHVNHFSLVTHGFGNIAMSGLIETIIRMVDESQSMLGTPLGQYQIQPPRGQRPQGKLSQQYVSPAMQLPKPRFMGMGCAPHMGSPQYMMGQGGQPRF